MYVKKLSVFIIIAVIVAAFQPTGYASEGIEAEIYAPDGSFLKSGIFQINPEFAGLSGGERAKYFRQFADSGIESRVFYDYLFDGLYGWIKEVADSYDKSGKEAEIIFDSENEKFTAVATVIGFRVDRKAISEDVAEGLAAGKISVRLKGSVINIKPEWKFEDITALRGEYSTYYGLSTAERKHNIALAASFIDGEKVLPGETFSFNKVVGRRTAERGFKSAKIIYDGEFVEGVGGGVCQVSTTLYNGILRAGLEVRVLQAHSMAVSYVPLSFDAMVSSRQDFCFFNNTAYPVYLAAKCDGETLSVRVYGERMPVGQKLEFRSVTKRVIKSQGADGRDGYESEAYLVKYIGDKIVEEKLIRRDRYSAGR